MFLPFSLFAKLRSWASITKGLDKVKKNKDEVIVQGSTFFLLPSPLTINLFFPPMQTREIKDRAQEYFREIADILAIVNRQMILIFKTNDLLRAIEHSLGTSGSMVSFIQVQKDLRNDNLGNGQMCMLKRI